MRQAHALHPVIHRLGPAAYHGSPSARGYIHIPATSCAQLVHRSCAQLPAVLDRPRSGISRGQGTADAAVGGRPAIGPPAVIPGLVTTVSMYAPETGVVGL